MARQPPFGPVLSAMSELKISDQTVTAPGEERTYSSSLAQIDYRSSTAGAYVENTPPTSPAETPERPDKEFGRRQDTQESPSALTRRAKASSSQLGQVTNPSVSTAATQTNLQTPVMSPASFTTALNNVRTTPPIVFGRCERCGKITSIPRPGLAAARKCRRCGKIARRLHPAPQGDVSSIFDN